MLLSYLCLFLSSFISLSFFLTLWLTLNRILSWTSQGSSYRLPLLIGWLDILSSYSIISAPLSSLIYYSVFLLKWRGRSCVKNGYWHIWLAFGSLLVVIYSTGPPPCSVAVGDFWTLHPWSASVSVQPQEAVDGNSSGTRRYTGRDKRQ